jgi:Family of unknown function (DUF6525)
MNFGNGGAPSNLAEVLSTSADEMRCYDRLPAPVRDLLKDAPTDFSAQQTAELVNRFGLQAALDIMLKTFHRAKEELVAERDSAQF